MKTLLDNYLLNAPATLAETTTGFKRDTDIMLTLLRDLGVKPE